MTLYFKEVQHGYIVYRPGTDKHTHFKNKRAAKNFIQLMKHGLMPNSPYYVESAKRVLTEDEYNRLKTKKKQKYYNVNRGVKHA